MAAPLTTTTHPLGNGVICVAVAGDVDLTTSDALRAALTSAASAGARELVIDLDAVTFLDSTGITALIAGRAAAAGNGIGFRVTNPHGPVARVLTITGLLSVLTDPAARTDD